MLPGQGMHSGFPAGCSVRKCRGSLASYNSRSFVDEISEVLSERNIKYQAAADYTLNTDSLSVEAVARQILESFWARGE